MAVYQCRSATLGEKDLQWLAKTLVVRTCVTHGPGELAHISQHYEACVKALDELHMSIPQFAPIIHVKIA